MNKLTYGCLCELAEKHGVTITENVRAFVREVERTDAAQPANEPIAWESTTWGYRKYLTQAEYERIGERFRKWYKPYRCSNCSSGTPIYQLRLASGDWRDQTEKSYLYNQQHCASDTRIVYTHPEASARLRVFFDKEELDALYEAIEWAKDEGLPGTAEHLQAIFDAHDPEASAPGLSDAEMVDAWLKKMGLSDGVNQDQRDTLAAFYRFTRASAATVQAEDDLSTKDFQSPNELERCPFCGGKACMKEVLNGDRAVGYRAHCANFWCTGWQPCLTSQTPEVAASVWNKRHSAATVAEPSKGFTVEEVIADFERVHGAGSVRDYVAQQAELKRCEYCDGTGDVTRADGEWLGECTVCKKAEASTYERSQQLSVFLRLAEVVQADSKRTRDRYPAQSERADQLAAFMKTACKWAAQSGQRAAISDDGPNAGLVDALMEACRRLPVGYNIHLDVENGWAGVELVDPSGNSVDYSDGESSLSEQTIAATKAAISASAKKCDGGEQK